MGHAKDERRAEDRRQRGVARSRRPMSALTAKLGDLAKLPAVKPVDLPQDLRHEVPWEDDGALLEVVQFGTGEVKLTFSHVYRGREEARDRVRVWCKTRLVVDYREGDGRVCGVSLSQHVVLPELLGREFLYGADVSPGAKTYLSYEYWLDHQNTWCCSEVVVGAFRRLAPKACWGKLSACGYPSPVALELPLERGAYQVPYLRNSLPDVPSLGVFRFPWEVRRESAALAGDKS